MIGIDLHKYRVVDEGATGLPLALKDAAGRYHLARTLDLRPAVGTALAGARPHLGFGLLACTKSGRVFRVIFEKINCFELDKP